DPGRLAAPPVYSGTPRANAPVHVNLGSDQVQAALRDLRADPRNLMRDPDSWRSENLTPFQKIVMAQLRGSGMLGPDGTDKLNKVMAGAGGPTDAVIAGATDALDDNGQLIEFGAGIFGALLAGTTHMAVVAPGMEAPAFHIPVDRDSLCL